MRCEAQAAWLEAAPERYRGRLAVRANIHRAPIQLIAIGNAAAALLCAGAGHCPCRLCVFCRHGRRHRCGGKNCRDRDTDDPSHGRPSQVPSPKEISQNRGKRTRHAPDGMHSLAARAIGGDALIRRPDAARQFPGLPEHIDRHTAARMKIAADAKPFGLQ